MYTKSVPKDEREREREEGEESEWRNTRYLWLKRNKILPDFPKFARRPS